MKIKDIQFQRIKSSIFTVCCHHHYFKNALSHRDNNEPSMLYDDKFKIYQKLNKYYNMTGFSCENPKDNILQNCKDSYITYNNKMIHKQNCTYNKLQLLKIID